MTTSQVEELKQEITEAWAGLDRVLRDLSEERIAGLRRDGWTVKDHLAHIAVADLYAAAALLGTPPHEAIGVDLGTLLHSSEDELNDALHRRDGGLTLQQVQELRLSAHGRLLRALETATAAGLDRPFAPYADLEGENGHTDTPTVLTIVRGNTSEHYDLHRGWIEAMRQAKP